MKFLKVITLAALGCAVSWAADAESLTITVTNIDDKGGDARVVLYSSEDTWLTHNGVNSLAQPAKPGEMVFTYPDLPPGTYAVLAYHDVNRNKDLDLNFLGIPTEQFGFSNNPGYNHTPKYSESTFQIADQPVKLDIKLSD